MALTLKQLLAENPSQEALAAAERLASFDYDLLQPLQLALLAQNTELIDSSPFLRRIEDALVRLLIEGRAPGQRVRLWNDWFLVFITTFRLFQGATEATVVAPSGMLHRRNPKQMKTDCGKEMNEKWLLQFARGAEIDPTYQFGHNACKSCFKSYRQSSAYARDIEVSFSDFADLYQQADETVRGALRASLTKQGGKLLKMQLKQNSVERALKAQGDYGFHSYYARNEVREALGGDYWNEASNFFAAFTPKMEAKLRRLLASELVVRMEQVPVGEARGWLFKLANQQEIIGLAEQHYGSLEKIPLPEGEALAELLASDSNIAAAFEKTVVPTLLTTLWLETVMPLVRERYPEAKDLPKTILTAYRLMPNRKPRHTNGTHTLDRQAFIRAVKERMSAEKIDVANLAAETYLAPAVIEALLAGEEPDFTTYFTLHEYIHTNRYGYGARQQYSKKL